MTCGKWIAGVAAVSALVAGGWAGWGALEKRLAAPQALTLPTTTVKRGDVLIAVTARGELQGGNSVMLTAPMTGGREMVITSLRRPGELVETGDVVARLDTTEQEFNLREAEADLEEAEQQLIQARADSEARQEEGRYALVHAKANVELAELDVRKNPLIAAIEARQNTLALEAARDHLRQLERDLSNRKATGQAGIAMQEAAVNKAKVKADVARRNIESMTLKAKAKGYVAIQNNTMGNFMFTGMQLPMLQVGDTVRAGMAVAQIPDLESWEITTRLSELDRGHLEVGQKAEVSVIAMPGRRFTGSITNIGGTSGPPWDRNFECKISVENPAPELRPGMSALVVVTTGLLKDVLWIPSQALFESDGRSFVYLQTPSGIRPADIKLVRRSESQVVLTGLNAGQRVALASPDQAARDKSKKEGSGGPMQAIPKS